MSAYPDRSDAAFDPAAPDMRAIVGRRDLLLITLDTLRYDAAQQCYQRGELPVLGPLLPPGGWERRHTPGSFTYAAHAAFFAGFLPTPARPANGSGVTRRSSRIS